MDKRIQKENVFRNTDIVTKVKKEGLQIDEKIDIVQVAHGVETNRARKFKKKEVWKHDSQSCKSLVEIP